MISDKRIIKTRNGIKTALMQLLLEQEIGKITISNLAATARINRSTFYLHYPDVNAVMKDIENEIETEISECISGFEINRVYESTYSILTALTKLLNARPDIKNYIFKSTSSNYIVSRIKEILTDKSIAAIKQTYEVEESDILLPLTFTAGGILDTYVKWVYSDKAISLEELIKTVSEFTKHFLEYMKIV